MPWSTAFDLFPKVVLRRRAAGIHEPATGDADGIRITFPEAPTQGISGGHTTAEIPLDQAVPGQKSGLQRWQHQNQQSAPLDGLRHIHPHRFTSRQLGMEKGVHTKHHIRRLNGWRTLAKITALKAETRAVRLLACFMEHIIRIIAGMHFAEVITKKREEPTRATSKINA